jgi:hypothetical protein
VERARLRCVLIRLAKSVNLTYVHIPGPEIEAGKFMELMYPRRYAVRFRLSRRTSPRAPRHSLRCKEIRTPNNKDHNGDPMRYVIKRGLTTLTTIGCLNGFESHVRRYFATRQPRFGGSSIYPMTTTLVHSPGVGTLGPSSSTPSASLLPSSPVARDRPIPLTSRLVRQCTGSGRSSRLSSLALTSTSKTTTTRFVSSFCLVLLYL